METEQGFDIENCRRMRLTDCLNHQSLRNVQPSDKSIGAQHLAEAVGQSRAARFS